MKEEGHREELHGKSAFSRRNFIKGMASAGIVTASGIALAGCAGKDASAGSEGGPETDPEAQARQAFEAEAAPIPPVDPPETSKRTWSWWDRAAAAWWEPFAWHGRDARSSS